MWALSFSCCLIHLVKISNEALLFKFKTYKSISTRRQITYFSALQAQKNISLNRHHVWVKNTLYYSNIIYLFALSLQKSRDLSPPGCARRVNLDGGGVKLRGFAERSKGIIEFYWQALFKTLWFKIIIMNYNKRYEVWIIFQGTPDWAKVWKLPYSAIRKRRPWS